jgi:hypothetical protein
MSKPLALFDDQMSCILRMAAPLAIDDRANFLHDVARELDGRELGDGVVGRVCREIQARYWKAPDFSRAAGSSKYC